jgi:nucleotide-binding universal stress UspA family protein
VVELTKRLESEVILFQVVEAGKHVHTIRGLEHIPFKDRDMDAMKISAQKYLAGIGSKLAGTKATIRSEVSVGDCAREIIKFADEANCRLIAMASHGHSGIEAWIHGSVTYKILQASNTPLLIVRALR